MTTTHHPADPDALIKAASADALRLYHHYYPDVLAARIRAGLAVGDELVMDMPAGRQIARYEGSGVVAVTTLGADGEPERRTVPAHALDRMLATIAKGAARGPGHGWGLPGRG